MCKCFTGLLLIVLIVSFFLAWVTVYPTGQAESYSGWSLASFPIQRYAALGLGILSCLLILCHKRLCCAASILAVIIAMGSAYCFWELRKRNFAGSDHFVYGFYVFCGALVAQFINSIGKCFCKCSCCSCSAKPAEEKK